MTRPSARAVAAGADAAIEIVPVAEHHAEGFHACLDVVACERRYLAQVEAPSLERIEAFARDSVANDAAQFMAVDGDRVVGWADVLPRWAHAVAHVGSWGMGLACDCTLRPSVLLRSGTRPAAS